MDENTIGTLLIEAAIEVHRELGPALLESVYEAALAYELEQRGLKVARQIPVPLNYKGIHFDEGFRADLIIEDKVIAELKSVEKVTPAHKKTNSDLPSSHRQETWIFIEFWRRSDENRNHTLRKRPPRIKLCASAPLRENNRT